jgi:hypothetical protein
MIGAEMGAKNGRAHFLGGSFTVAADHTNDRNRKALAPVGRKLTQREAGIGDTDQRLAGMDAAKAVSTMVLQRLQHFGHIGMTIETVALEGKKELA